MMRPEFSIMDGFADRRATGETNRSSFSPALIVSPDRRTPSLVNPPGSFSNPSFDPLRRLSALLPRCGLILSMLFTLRACESPQGPKEEIVYDEPDSTLQIITNSVHWDLYDSVDLKNRLLFKYHIDTTNPKGHLKLTDMYDECDSCFYAHGVDMGDILVTLLDGLGIYNAGTDTSLNPLAVTYKSYSRIAVIYSKWMSNGYLKNLTLGININGSDYYKLIFPEGHKYFYVTNLQK